MILTGEKIKEEVAKKRIIIDPFDKHFIEPNSYGFHLTCEIMIYQCSGALDIRNLSCYERFPIPPEGYRLEPNRFYLSSTAEILGSDFYAKTLHANRSLSTLGMWIHFSAPLGHTGAIIPWTLELLATHPIIVYPYMRIGKIAFWENAGEIVNYNGRYKNSQSVIASRMYQDDFNHNGQPEQLPAPGDKR
jgi:dCTP deaminase